MDGEELTFDEILQDPKYQAEFDKRVQKALEKSNAAREDEWKKKEAELANREEEIRKNVLEEMEAKAREAEENAKLTEAEKYKKELDKLKQDNLSMQSKLDLINRKEKIQNYVKEKGYSQKILKLINPANITDADIESKVDEINSTFSETVSSELNEKLKENPDVLLPSMVCLDGFILTHTVEPVEIPDQESVDKFLPPYVPKHAYLDPNDPMSIGNFADTHYYTEARHDMEVAMTKSIGVIEETCKEFAEIFGREYGLVEPYKTEDADIVIVAMGSLCSTIRVVVDQLREKGEKVGLLKIRAYRPFPVEAIKDAVKNCQKIAVIDINFSFVFDFKYFKAIKNSNFENILKTNNTL